MSGEPDQTDDPQLSLDKLRKFLSDWAAIVVALAGVILAILTPFGLSSSASQAVSYVLALAVIVGAGGYHLILLRRKRSARRAQLQALDTSDFQGSAIRGLYPFGKDDRLPGERRRQEANSLVTRILNEDFLFTVVSGESGCGKTSLLSSEVRSLLEGNDCRVIFVDRPSKIIADTATENGERESFRVQEIISGLRDRISDVDDKTRIVLVIDQFEELFIEFSSKEERSELDEYLKSICRREHPIRLLLAIRKDFIDDIYDFEFLGDNFSSRTRFPLRNFDTDEAKEIILECASRDDLEVSEDFAKALALDLSNRGQVRPPELQIVLEALRGRLTLRDYRLQGGARGILAKYIETSIKQCKAPEVGEQVLRALCDFSASAKTDPKTIEDLSMTIRLPASHRTASRFGIIGAILRQFESDRIVITEQERNKAYFSLIHDYLVEPVAQATRNTWTLQEEASQLLTHYLALARRDPKSRIPMRSLWLIKRYADSKELEDGEASQLVLGSVISLWRGAAVYAISGLLLAALGVSALTYETGWKRKNVGRHWKQGDHGDIIATKFPSSALVLTMPESASFYSTHRTLASGDIRHSSYPGSDYWRVWSLQDPATSKINIDSNASIGIHGRYIAYLNQIEQTRETKEIEEKIEEYNFEFELVWMELSDLTQIDLSKAKTFKFNSHPFRSEFVVLQDNIVLVTAELWGRDRELRAKFFDTETGTESPWSSVCHVDEWDTSYPRTKYIITGENKLVILLQAPRYSDQVSTTPDYICLITAFPQKVESKVLAISGNLEEIGSVADTEDIVIITQNDNGDNFVQILDGHSLNTKLEKEEKSYFGNVLTYSQNRFRALDSDSFSIFRGNHIKKSNKYVSYETLIDTKYNIMTKSNEFVNEVISIYVGENLFNNNLAITAIVDILEGRGQRNPAPIRGRKMHFVDLRSDGELMLLSPQPLASSDNAEVRGEDDNLLLYVWNEVVPLCWTVWQPI